MYVLELNSAGITTEIRILTFTDFESGLLWTSVRSEGEYYSRKMHLLGEAAPDCEEGWWREDVLSRALMSPGDSGECFKLSALLLVHSRCFTTEKDTSSVLI